jgi:hypothetical protein
MKESICSLSPEQAQRALLIFYESLPGELWQGPKPSWPDIEAVAENLQDEAPGDLKGLIAGILKGPSANDRGELAKILLNEFAQCQPFRAYVEAAVQSGSEPQMAPVPLIILAAFVVFPVLPRIAYDNREGRLKIVWDPSGNLNKTIHSLTELAKSLPSELLSRSSSLGA